MTPTRGITPADYQPLLDLNNRYKEETSLLDSTTWKQLVKAAFFARCCGVDKPEGFLLAFGSAQPFSNANFLWFKKRLDSFVYVDRIVVSSDAQGRGSGRALYENLFSIARDAGYARITCEVNERPPNPGSDAFHKKMGFVPIESVALAGDKVVRYLVKEL